MDLSIIDLRVLREVSRFASTDEARYYLNGVLVEIDERGTTYVATDGHRCVAHRVGLPHAADGEEESRNTLTGCFIIPTEQCRSFKFSKKSDTLAELSAVVDEGLKITFRGVGVTFAPIDGAFPDWRRIIPRSGPAEIGQFNGEYLASFTKFGAALELGSPHIVHYGPALPALVRWADSGETVGVVMPFRSEDLRARALPGWVGTRPDTQPEVDQTASDAAAAAANTAALQEGIKPLDEAA